MPNDQQIIEIKAKKNDSRSKLTGVVKKTWGTQDRKGNVTPDGIPSGDNSDF